MHELAHQWWQSVVATNEAEEPWLDEGFTDYSTVRAMSALGLELYDCGGWPFSYLSMRRMEYQLNPQTPMAGAAWDFDFATYNIAAYSKPALALSTLERQVGDEAMRTFLRAYFARHAFTHPRAQDVRAVMRDTLGAETADLFFTHMVERGDWMDAFVRCFDRDAIELERAGDLCLPLMVDLVNGVRRERIPWPCDTAELSIAQPASPWREVIISPQMPPPIDLNHANNGARLGVDVGTWLSLAARMVYALQSLSFWGGAAW